MNRRPSTVQTAPVMSNPVGQVTPVASARPFVQSTQADAAAPARSDLYRSSYVGKSYLRRSRRSTSASQSMFRIS
ncbi:hypothetical protein [Lysobacter sp. H21R4]|nr:hypothetical protein [Lysobacter sp. H21R4]